jgi:D-alanyl-lipoteichoic acid acyltransferase DltB (MBOAT superfamily)
VLFNSWGYLLFLLLAVPLHWALGTARSRVALLAAGSVLFYAMWRWEFTLLVIFSACVDYVAAGRIAATGDTGARKRWLLTSLSINLGLLAFFKYTYFVWDNVRLAGSALGSDLPTLQSQGLSIVLPLGISFYTFQTISYTIDVYRGVVQPIPRFTTFLCYVTFWPQLIAGPVLRAGEVVPQLEAERRFEVDDLVAGIRRVVAGLFKKVVLADSLAVFVDAAFALDPGSLNALDVWVATFLFGFQIYFDFAGYSDVAIGSARMLGIRFPENFDWPYMARSPREFWTRWHISLSAWIRDYLYLPLTGQRFRTQSTGGIGEATRPSALNRNGALLATWFIMGLWHGAAWTFAVWGLYHAGLILLYRLVPPLGKLADRRPVLAWGILLPLSMAGWIPFRATSLAQTFTLFGKLFDPREYGLAGHVVDIYAYFWCGVVLLGMIAAHLLQRRDERRPFPAWAQLAGTACAHAGMVCLVLVCLRAVKQFIYFQF